MKTLNLVFAISVNVFVMACTDEAEKIVDEDLDSSIGWFHGPCMAVKNSKLTPGQKVSLVVISEAPERYLTQISNTEATRENCYALFDDRRRVNSDAGYSFYMLETTRDLDLGVGYVSNSAAGEMLDKKPMKDFSFCSTSEGVRFDVVGSNASEHSIAWQGYYYLGYDIESTCEA